MSQLIEKCIRWQVDVLLDLTASNYNSGLEVKLQAQSHDWGPTNKSLKVLIDFRESS